MSLASPSTRKVAHSPFNDPSADIILRSVKSNVDFYVYKLFLSYASPFFKEMFTLPQEGISDQEMKDGIPVIPVEEDSQTLHLLLGYCYPKWQMQSAIKWDLKSLILVLEASIKYGMEDVEKSMRAELVTAQFIKAQPVRFYAIAIRHRLGPEAVKWAARETSKLPLLGEYVEELEDITAGALHRLQRYHMDCSNAAVRVVKDLVLASNKSTEFHCSSCPSSNHSIVTSRWWVDYLAQAKEAVRKRPSGAVVVDADLLNGALRMAKKCKGCWGSAFDKLKTYSASLAAEVDGATSILKLQVKM